MRRWLRAGPEGIPIGVPGKSLSMISNGRLALTSRVSRHRACAWWWPRTIPSSPHSLFEEAYFPIMLNLSYRLKNDLGDLSEPALFVESNEVDLRFRLALGDLILTTPQADFSTRWGWVPLIDFAVSVQEIIDDLRRGVRQARFEFTES